LSVYLGLHRGMQPNTCSRAIQPKLQHYPVLV